LSRAQTIYGITDFREGDTTMKSDDTIYTESVPALGKRMLGLGRAASYEAAKRGIIPTIRIGRLLKGLPRVLEARLSRDPEQTA
jgi:hypothetical protein